MTTVTLIGERLAEVGQEFVYHGPASKCEGCPYRDQCLNLEQGVKYKVTDIRENAQTLECAVHDRGVRAVEVTSVPIRANVPSANAYAGSRVQLAGPCPYTDCPSHEYCEADGVSFDKEYRIQEVVGDPPHEHCEMDRDLTLAVLAPRNED